MTRECNETAKCSVYAERLESQRQLLKGVLDYDALSA